MRRHSFTIDGSFPLNTSGGQLSMGQAGAAGGHLGLVEAIRQLIGRSARRRGRRGRVFGLVSGFGMINYDRGLCSGAAILASAGRQEGQEAESDASPFAPAKAQEPAAAHRARRPFRRRDAAGSRKV